MSALTFMEQQQQFMADGFVVRPVVSGHDDGVIDAAVIDDIIIELPKAVVLTLNMMLDGLATGLVQVGNCVRQGCNLTASSACRQLGRSRQDRVYTCETRFDDKPAVCAVGFDGHGTNDCVYSIDHMDVDQIIKTELDPIGVVHNGLQKAGRNVGVNSGATGIYARLTETSVDCASIGDSFMFVFVNGKLAWKSTPHTLTNPVEVARLVAPKFRVKGVPDSYMKLLGKSRITQAQDSMRAEFVGTGLKLMPTMSLGHQNTTGYAPETVHIDVRPTDLVRVVGMSDGVNDMLYLDADDVECYNDWLALMDNCSRETRMAWTKDCAGRMGRLLGVCSTELLDVKWL